MELILRIELETSPLPRECSTAELYEHAFKNYSSQPMGCTKKNITIQLITDCRDV